jgi:AraC family transcriptional regulator, regulatory protein of adaptative response / methylated-DNA-[protein]-cysteine methyltransferase
MLRAFMVRDGQFDGIFFAGVKSTRIFCRPSCPARRPTVSAVEFFGTDQEALTGGFRPCKRCRPMEPRGATPDAIRRLLSAVDAHPSKRLRDEDLRLAGLHPVMVRRWFRVNLGMTFQAYHRKRRLARAIGALNRGEPVTRTAFDHGYESLSGFQAALRRVTGESAKRSRSERVVHLTRLVTPLGPMILGSSDEGVHLLEFSDVASIEDQLGRLVNRLRWTVLPGMTEIGRQFENELDQYFAGRLQRFESPLVLRGTAFQLRVWEGLGAIPYGTTSSYGEQAATMGAPSAVRAVARANGDNPIAIAVPCHRVIGANGTLTGYGGGLWRKQWLLDHERSFSSQGQTSLNLR